MAPKPYRKANAARCAVPACWSWAAPGFPCPAHYADPSAPAGKSVPHPKMATRAGIAVAVVVVLFGIGSVSALSADQEKATASTATASASDTAETKPKSAAERKAEAARKAKAADLAKRVKAKERADAAAKSRKDTTTRWCFSMRSVSATPMQAAIDHPYGDVTVVLLGHEIVKSGRSFILEPSIGDRIDALEAAVESKSAARVETAFSKVWGACEKYR
jgi:hypothetical protein